MIPRITWIDNSSQIIFLSLYRVSNNAYSSKKLHIVTKPQQYLVELYIGSLKKEFICLSAITKLLIGQP